MSMVRRFVRGVIVDDAERVFVLAETRGNEIIWNLPGGRIEPNESGRDALVREIQEELGITVTFHRFLYSQVIGFGGAAWEGLFYGITGYQGNITIAEPHICSDSRFVKATDLDLLNKPEVISKPARIFFRGPANVA